MPDPGHHAPGIAGQAHLPEHAGMTRLQAGADDGSASTTDAINGDAWSGSGICTTSAPTDWWLPGERGVERSDGADHSGSHRASTTTRGDEHATPTGARGGDELTRHASEGRRVITGVPMAGQNRIVVGIDGSEGSRRALRWAFRQAEMSGADLGVVLTWRVPPAVGDTPIGYDFSSDAERTLDEAIRDIVALHPTVNVTASAIQGPSGSVLRDAAVGADVLVVGSQGQGARIGNPVGSTAQYCVSHATGPVMVVHQPPFALDGDHLPASSRAPTAATHRENLEVLTEGASLELLRSEHVGRICVTVHGRPEIFPVNYSLDASGSVVLKTAQGTKLVGGVNHHVVFEVDRFDRSSPSGWSVIVHGVAQQTTRVDLGGDHLQSWRDDAPLLVRIAQISITGRRIHIGRLG